MYSLLFPFWGTPAYEFPAGGRGRPLGLGANAGMSGQSGHAGAYASTGLVAAQVGMDTLGARTLVPGDPRDPVHPSYMA